MKTIQWLIVLIFIVLIGLFYWRERSWQRREAKWAGLKSDTILVQGKTTQKTDTLTFIKQGSPEIVVRHDTVFVTRVDTLLKTLTSSGIREFQDRQPTFSLKGKVPFPDGNISLAYDYFKKPVWSRFTFGVEGAVGSISYISGDVNYRGDWGIGATYFFENNNVRKWNLKIRRNF